MTEYKWIVFGLIKRHEIRYIFLRQNPFSKERNMERRRKQLYL